MRRKYLITRRALKDLQEIWSYTRRNWSVEQADRYYSLLVDEFDFVANNFETGRSMEHVKEGYRASNVKSYVIYFRRTEGEVEIVRVLHRLMDVEQGLQ